MTLRILSALVVTGLLVACAAPTVDEDSTDSTQDELRGRNNPCATVRCAAGYRCVKRGNRASCVVDPAQAECTTNADCRKESNYCGGCHCYALASGESGPTCSNPVMCFADPCSVTAGQAACVSGQCVLQ